MTLRHDSIILFVIKFVHIQVIFFFQIDLCISKIIKLLDES